MTSLSKAIQESRLWGERAVAVVRAKAAAAPATGLPSIASGSINFSGSGTGAAKNQLSHFRGHVYTAIGAIAKRVAGQPINAYGRGSKPSGPSGVKIIHKSAGGELEKLDSHPLLDLLSDPNDIMVAWSLWYSVVASLNLTGKAYLWFCKSLRDDREYDCWPIPPSWVSPSDDYRTSYSVRTPGSAEPFSVDGQFIAFFSLPDPSNPFGAVSPTQAQALAIDTDEQLQAAQCNEFKNRLRPTMIVKVGEMAGGDGIPAVRPTLTDAQRLQLTNSIRSRFNQQRNDGVIVCDGSIESVMEYEAKNEMDFLESGKDTRGRIFHAFGVNPIVVGELQGANRAQSVTAEESFCSNVCNPIIMLMNQVLNGWVVPLFQDEFGAESEQLRIEIEPCRARDPEQEAKDWSIAATKGYVTPNEYRTQRLGLPVIDGGDELPSTAAPAISPPAAALAKRIDPYTLKRING